MKKYQIKFVPNRELEWLVTKGWVKDRKELAGITGDDMILPIDPTKEWCTAKQPVLAAALRCARIHLPTLNAEGGEQAERPTDEPALAEEGAGVLEDDDEAAVLEDDDEAAVHCDAGYGSESELLSSEAWLGSLGINVNDYL